MESDQNLCNGCSFCLTPPSIDSLNCIQLPSPPLIIWASSSSKVTATTSSYKWVFSMHCIPPPLRYLQDSTLSSITSNYVDFICSFRRFESCEMLKHHWYPSAEKVTPAAWFVTYDYCIHISETWLSELILESRWADRRWTHRFEGTLVFNFFAFIYQLFNLMLSYFTSPYQSSLIQTSICVHRLNTSRHHLSEGFVY